MIYSFIVVRDGSDVGVFDTVDEAFTFKRQRGKDGKERGDVVFVELRGNGYRAQVLRPG